MDRVTKAYLDAFMSEQTLPAKSESTSFELFVDYCVVSDQLGEQFNVTDIHTGGGSDLGLDGVAVIVNGTLVATMEELIDLIDTCGTLDVSFVLIQAKTSSTFSSEQITTFCEGAAEFFAESLSLPANEMIVNVRAMMQLIYDHSLKFRKGKPVCRLYYVTTGQWQDDQYLLAKIGKQAATLKSTGLFADVIITPMGADELHASYQRTRNSVTTEIQFPAKVLLPEIPGVAEAYLGVIPATEFLKIVTDPIGNIRKSIFYDNVRDFQEYNNDVNIEIQQTLRNSGKKGRFVVLNNGVTIVARELETTRDKVLITDYQIVNGCQTSHVIFDERKNLDDTVQIPLKVISTQDEDVINSVITATNRQTEVTTEDLYALGGFAKKLETLLAAYEDKKKLYYERRSKQYNSIVGIEKVRIITKWQMIRAFAAMFLDEAHRANGYSTELRSQVGVKIFNKDHKLEPYYTAAFAHYKIEFFFRNGGVSVEYKPARYQLLMAFRYLTSGPAMSELTANKIKQYSDSVCEVLWDAQKALEVFKVCCEAVDAAAGGAKLTRELTKTRTFTDTVRNYCKNKYEESQEGD